MLLRRMMAAVLPPVYCVAAVFAFRWLDGQSWLPVFWGYVLKGLLLGVVLAVILPTAGVKSRMNGLQPWVLVGAGLVLVLIVAQFLSFSGVISLPLLAPDPQLVLAESAAVGFLAVTVLLNRKR